MDRRDRITKWISKDQRGIEIGPYFNPLVPKRLGYKVVVLDVFDAETLRRHAAEDPNVPKDMIANIEEVDLLGTSSAIADAVSRRYELGTFTYIVSSHNFEHLPDPIRFLQGCEKVLKDGGILSMAIPDRRTCFDYFRPHSTLAEMLEAYFDARERPSQAQIFAQNSLHSRYFRNGQQLIGFSLEDDPGHIKPLPGMKGAFDAWRAYLASPDANYRDAHCWTFTPASLELILQDLRFLGLLKMQLIEISEAHGNEFYVALRNGVTEEKQSPSLEEYDAKRCELLHRINNEASENAMRTFELKRQLGICQRERVRSGDANEDEWRLLQQSYEQRISALEDSLAALADQLGAVVKSTSWRVTKPLRLASSVLRGRPYEGVEMASLKSVEKEVSELRKQAP